MNPHKRSHRPVPPLFPHSLPVWMHAYTPYIDCFHDRSSHNCLHWNYMWQLPLSLQQKPQLVYQTLLLYQFPGDKHWLPPSDLFCFQTAKRCGLPPSEAISTVPYLRHRNRSQAVRHHHLTISWPLPALLFFPLLPFLLLFVFQAEDFQLSAPVLRPAH